MATSPGARESPRAHAHAGRQRAINCERCAVAGAAVVGVTTGRRRRDHGRRRRDHDLHAIG